MLLDGNFLEGRGQLNQDLFVEHQSIPLHSAKVQPNLVLSDPQSPRDKRAIRIIAAERFKHRDGRLLQNVVASSKVSHYRNDVRRHNGLCQRPKPGRLTSSIIQGRFLLH